MIAQSLIPGQLFQLARRVLQPRQKLALLSVLAESLRHCGTRRSVQFTACDGNKLRVDSEVTDVTRPMLSVKKFQTLERSQSSSLTAEERSSETLQHSRKITNILHKIEGFNIVHENGAHVMDTTTSQCSSEQYVQPVISDNKLDRALSQAAKEHERKCTLETEEHEKAFDQPDKKAAEQLAKNYEPTQQE